MFNEFLCVCEQHGWDFSGYSQFSGFQEKYFSFILLINRQSATLCSESDTKENQNTYLAAWSPRR